MPPVEGPTWGLRWMARFDISPGNDCTVRAGSAEPGDPAQASDAPPSTARRFGSNSIRMRARNVAHRNRAWGLVSSGVLTAIGILSSGVSGASADPVTPPDPPPRRGPPVVGPSRIPPTSDLDGLYVWLGPVG